jgi:hypothetical protein
MHIQQGCVVMPNVGWWHLQAKRAGEEKKKLCKLGWEAVIIYLFKDGERRQKKPSFCPIRCSQLATAAGHLQSR